MSLILRSFHQRGKVGNLAWSIWKRRNFLLAYLTCFYVLFLLLKCSMYVLSLDLFHDGFSLKPALDILQGGILFKHTFYQYGILTPYLHALILAIFGKTLFTLKIYYALLYGATFALVLELHQRIFGPVVAVGVCLMWVALSPFHWIGMQPNPVAEALFVSCLTVSLATRSWSNKKYQYFVVGVGVATCFALRHTAGFYLGSAFATFGLLELRKKMLHVQSIPWKSALLGILVVLVPLICFLFITGAWHDWWLQTVAFPKQFYVSDNAWGGSHSSYFLNWLEVTMTQRGRAWYWSSIVLGVLFSAVAIFRNPQEHHLLMALVATAMLFNSLPNGCDAHMWWACSTFGFGVLVSGILKQGRFGWGLVFLVFVFAILRMDQRIINLGSVGKTVEQETLKFPPELEGTQVASHLARQFELTHLVLRQLQEKYPHIKMNPEGVTVGHHLFMNKINFHPITTEWAVLTERLYPNYRSLKAALSEQGCFYLMTSRRTPKVGYSILVKTDTFSVQIPNDLNRRCAQRD